MVTSNTFAPGTVCTIRDAALLSETPYLPLVLIRDVGVGTVVISPLFTGAAFASSRDLAVNEEIGGYRNFFVAAGCTVIVPESALFSSVGILSEDLLRQMGKKMRNDRYREALPGVGDPMELFHREMEVFFNRYAGSLKNEEAQVSLFERLQRTFSLVGTERLVVECAACGNRREGVLTLQGAATLYYAIERRFDQDNDLVISINGRIEHHGSEDAALWLVVCDRDEQELFRRRIVAEGMHFEEYLYLEEIITRLPLERHEELVAKLAREELVCFICFDIA